MYEAAVVILTRVKRASRLKDWALAIARRSGAGKARVALARKLTAVSLVNASHASVMFHPLLEATIRREDALRGEGAADCVASRWEGL